MSEHADRMPDNLAWRKGDIASLTGARFASSSGNISRMPKKPPGPLQIAISSRLKAIQEELGKTDSEMAKIVGKGRTTWANWINKENMPEEQAMIDLCKSAKIRMDWLYRGDGDSMPVRLFIRLELRLLGVDPDTATPEQVAPVAAKVAVSAAP